MCSSTLRSPLALTTVLLCSSLLTSLPVRAAAPRKAVCNVQNYGAKADGVTKDTHAIQSAIDACAQKGGGTVVLAAGTYLSAPIVLKSNINLRLEKGATLLGSQDEDDYAKITEFRAPGRQALVSATGARNVSITGQGTIDGAGQSWWKRARSYRDSGVMGFDHPRPRLVVFDHCHHVLVDGVTIQNSPMWQLVPYYSDDVTVRNVKVLAPANSPNTDAIDPFSTSNMVIDHVYADVGDDDIAIKSGEANSSGNDSPSRNITIRNCTFMHGHGLSVGSEIAGGAENILAEHIQFDGTSNGIRVKANRDRGNDVGHLVFRDLQMKNVKNTLVISEYYPRIVPRGAVARAPVTRLTPHFHDITIENLTSTGSSSAGAIFGLPESPVTGVVLTNVHISAMQGLTIGYAQVTGTNVHVEAARGAPIMDLAGAKASF